MIIFYARNENKNTLKRKMLVNTHSNGHKIRQTVLVHPNPALTFIYGIWNTVLYTRNSGWHNNSFNNFTFRKTLWTWLHWPWSDDQASAAPKSPLRDGMIGSILMLCPASDATQKQLSRLLEQVEQDHTKGKVQLKPSCQMYPFGSA